MNVKVYTTHWCPYCTNAKRFLNEKNIEFEEINIEKEGMNREDLEKITGGRTVPQIVIDDTPIGGYKDIIALDSEGKFPG
ncbi:MAG: glutaredoxin [Candidatus Marinimicrobia bacterium]|jgi:GrxC family glutaredoxin|nr:glutaredoxin [Candidatus Neomarinimicrobiota bacterium]MDP7608147.1 glutaredoxin domain-containing protein [Candidatus Neomarinimicrobiota bacterium]